MDPKGIFLMVLMAATGAEEDVLADSCTTVRRLYHFFQTPTTWSKAQSFCRMNYIDLARADNMMEHVQMIKSIDNTQVSVIWIGLKRTATKRWGWSEGSESFNWNPSPDTGDCGWMGPEGNWNTGQCDDLKAFLCFKYDSNGRESYILNTTTMSWQDAQSFCRQYYTDLVSVTGSQHEEIRMHANNNSVWIGLFRDVFMWTDGSTGSFRNWDQSNPDNLGGNQNCATVRRVYQYQWDDSGCGYSYPFVCYSEVKITKRSVVKVKLSSMVNLNLPTKSDLLLKQFQARLENRFGCGVKVHWQADVNGQIFHKQDNNNGTDKTGC